MCFVLAADEPTHPSVAYDSDSDLLHNYVPARVRTAVRIYQHAKAEKVQKLSSKQFKAVASRPSRRLGDLSEIQ